MRHQLTLEQIQQYFRQQNRRRFLQTTALGLAALPFAAHAGESSEKPEASQENEAGSGPTSLVAYAHHIEAVKQGRPVCRRMLDAAMMALTGKKTPNQAWREFVSPSDVVCLKMNGLGGRGISNNPEVTDMIVASLVQAGVPGDQIILWDNSAGHVRNCGYELNGKGSAPRVWCGNDAGYSDAMEFGSGTTRLTKIVTEYATAIICLPVLKDHSGAGVTLSLKNMSHGATDNPGALHGNNCDPYIAEVCALEPIQRKWRLSILDGLRGVWDGGPGLNPSKSWYPQAIWASADPVALDTIGREVIEAKRKEVGAKPLAEVGRPPKHIRTGAKRGLGTANRQRIQVVEAEVV